MCNSFSTVRMHAGRIVRQIRSIVAWLTVLLFVSLTQNAFATRINVGALPPEPGNHFSFVRDGNRNIVALDFQYANDVRNAFAGTQPTYSFVDIVMQQCFGGGFLDDIDATLQQSYTFASASGWSESAFNDDVMVPRTVDNFSRAWREDAALYPGTGMLGHFATAAFGFAPAPPLPAIAKDPFSPVSNFPGAVENPQYASPDPAAGGFNDLRVLGDEGGDVTQYALLIAWDEPDPRHAINIQRMWDTLTLVYNVNPINIAVLYDAPNPPLLAGLASVLPSDPAPIGLPQVVVDDDNTRLSWLNALAGGLFPVAPDGADKLFIYNTGHGGGARLVPVAGGVRVVLDGDADGLENDLVYRIPIADGFDTYAGPSSVTTSVSGFGGLDLQDLIQLSFAEEVPDDILLRINGTDFGALSAFLLPSGSEDIFGLDPLVMQPTFTYQILVDHALLGLDPLVTTIELLNPGSSSPLQLVAADFIGGDQEYLVVLVPEPGILALLTLGLAGMRRFTV